MFASKAGHLFLGWSKLCYESEVAELLFPGMICFYWIEVRDGKEAKQDHNDFCVSQERLFFSDLWVHSRTGCRAKAPSKTSSIWSKQQNPVCWSTWVQSLLNLSLRISWWCKDKPKYSREDQLMVQGQTKIVGKPGIQWNPPPGLRMSSWKGTF